MSGLINRTTLYPLHLRSSTIFAEIKGFTSRTTAILTYYNHNRTNIEGLFILPLTHNSAIVEFECLVEGHYISASIKHSKEIENKEILFGKEQMHDDVFNVCIGNIAPWVLVEIQVTIVSEICMTLNGDALHYKLPQTFSPKIVTEVDVKHAYKTRAEPLGSFQIEMLIEAPCLLCGIQSNTHPIQVDAPPFSLSGSKLRVSLPENYTPSDNVFELVMFLCRPREPYIFIEEPSEQKNAKIKTNPISNIMNNPILMLSYSPEILNQYDELNHESPIEQIGEFLFIINCNIVNDILKNDLRDSWILLMKSLPENSYFNVFYISKQPLFSCSQVYNEENHIAAIEYIGVETNIQRPPSLLEAVEWLYNTDEIEHVPKQVLLVTLGNLFQCKETLEVVKKKNYKARIFVFCMENDNEIFSLQKLSYLTKAKNFTFSEKENLQVKIIEGLSSALQPAITDLKVSWILPDAYDVIYTPENLPPLYYQDRLNLFAILATKEDDEKDEESGNSIKEFWFEDFYPIEEIVFEPYVKRDFALENEILSDKYNLCTCLDNENEVFLTEDEVNKLHESTFVKKKNSIEKIQSWKISKHPDEIDDTLDKELNSNSDIRKLYLQQHDLERYFRNKNGDSSKSTSSINSDTSNTSSIFVSFPGYPTRLSSCRSLDTRSPHVSKYFDDEIPEDLITQTLILNDKVKCRRITQALINENANTHILDYSNEDLLSQLLESEVSEKRSQLHEWVNLQEEMIQCTWPKTFQKKKSSEWRDSGFGRYSSTDQRSSDFEDDVRRKSFSQSSSGYSENEDINCIVDRCKIIEQKKKTLSNSHIENLEDQELKEPSVETNRKNSKPKVIITSFINKLRSFVNTVSEKSKNKTPSSESITSLPQTLKRKLLSRTTSNVGNMTLKKETENENDLTQILEDLITKETVKQTSKPNKKPSVSRNPPIIENSRTFSSSSIFEIGQSEIGDVNNLQLHPTQALIYLSGQIGKHLFKRIIPFQLHFNTVQSSSELNKTVMHQLAAKSIIKDLEMQLDDELFEAKSQMYIKSLIAEVSVAAHIPSKYTILTLNDDKCNEKQITSICTESAEKGYEMQKKLNYSTNSTKIWQIINPLTSITNQNRMVKKSFINLIELMQHDGSWVLSNTLASIISVNFIQLQESCPFEVCREQMNQFENYENIWTTAIALSWLDMFWKSTYSHWILVNQKSMHWLMRQNLPNGFDLNDILLLSQQTLNILYTR
ncbi:von Willebrand factor A domain-containing protein DDB_G0292028 [Hydra vulgaris]|uniref:von Willebrand factor A domain-containing protein DDB_G0292028 n=1 Tax=Hydra vulgaris TaxID=6087 RepID=A0ABM4BLH4_HYDVU